ncbi:hypothetical protein [Cerasicoccus maritimus]|uniref:hypothetical protein n=1 Tax=Cerasicoccus maritimus TaxID=490089 RepID=UPI0028525F9D|nr:hypothetical protein [Cerasicoccus maritimus]
MVGKTGLPLGQVFRGQGKVVIPPAKSHKQSSARILELHTVNGRQFPKPLELPIWDSTELPTDVLLDLELMEGGSFSLEYTLNTSSEDASNDLGKQVFHTGINVVRELPQR